MEEYKDDGYLITLNNDDIITIKNKNIITLDEYIKSIQSNSNNIDY